MAKVIDLIKQKARILKTVNSLWSVMGRAWVEDDLTVNVKGFLSAKRKGGSQPAITHLPVKFGHIEGDYGVKVMGLETLEGSPHTVSGWVYLDRNELTSLEHCPSGMRSLSAMANNLTDLTGLPHIGQYDLDVRSNPLKSLQGLPETPGVIKRLNLTYEPELPLLRTLVAEAIGLESIGFDPSVKNVQRILNEHTGRGKLGAIACATALHKAGFSGNAKW